MRAGFCLGVLLFLAGAAATACAQPHIDIPFTAANPKEPGKAQKQLAKWLKAVSKREFEPKIRLMVRDWQISLAPEGGAELRDAAASLPAKAWERDLCATLELCPAPPGSAHAESIDQSPRQVFELPALGVGVAAATGHDTPDCRRHPCDYS